MAAKWYHRVSRRKLYTAEDLENLLFVLLDSTYDKQAVHDALDEIDRFDAGALDNALQRHILNVLAKLRKLDKADDEARTKRWIKQLR